ncbi:MAG TPA: agmatinase [Actinomycetota bacterium]|nr:agmatinase [Actinomycetota bacterium]
MEHTGGGDRPLGPIDPLEVPRFAGPATFARLPRLDQVRSCDVAIVGVPFDAGTTYRPGARFGPSAIRAGSRLLRGYHPGLDVEPFAAQQVADAGDLACTPFDIAAAVGQIEAAARSVEARHLVALGGDHTVSLPLLRVAARRFGKLALIHFDAHLDTWNSYFGADLTHGTPFRRAAEEGLFADDVSAHVGIRGPLFGRQDLVDDRGFGFTIVGAFDYERRDADEIAGELRRRVGNAPVYLSIDVDVMDPANAPGTGTPEAGGLTSRELLATLRALDGVHLVGADVMEVAPAYDHAEITSIAAANVVYELLGIFGRGAARR